jgi:hypothetical protein
LDLFLEFGDKLLHGVSPWFCVEDLDIQQRTPSEERQLLFAACRYAGQDVIQDVILLAGWQPVPAGPFTVVGAGYQPAAGCQPAPQLPQNSRCCEN